MTQRERQLLEWIRENPTISQQELADKAGITRSSVAVHISNLMKKGCITGKGYIVRTAPYVAVVGGVNMDIGAVSAGKLVARDSNPGHVTTSLGGVGRNIAHNLCLLGQQTAMVTVMGDDDFGRRVQENAKDIGLDLSASAVLPDCRTGTYLYIAGPDGDMALAVNDMDIYQRMTPDFLRQRLDFINHAGLVVVETNLPEASIQWLCSHCTAPVLADPVSTIKAPKLLPVLDKLTALKPNRMEAELLSGVTIRDETDVQKAAKVLLDKGVQQVYISLGSDGLYAEDQAGRHVRLPCPKVQVVNATGGGDAMAAALASGKVARYVTDFPNGKTANMPGCIAIPHLGASTEESEDNCAKMAVQELMDYLENGNIKNSVNYPNCDMGICRAEGRITLLHRNIPNSLGRFTAAIAGENINIDGLVNKSRGEYAYTMLDLDRHPSADVVEHLKQIDGVLKVRVIK